MKIEIEKPFIPKFVADWIEQLYGQDFISDDLLEALFTRNYDIGELKIFRWFIENKSDFIIAVMYGYEIKKEIQYYAKIKGWELLDDEFRWVYLKNFEEFILEVTSEYTETDVMTKEEWNELGINDTNADFERVN